MIYSMNGKYYINISPSIYKEIELRLDGDDLILVPTKEKIEVNNSSKMNVIYLNNPIEKEKLIKNFFIPNNNNIDEQTKTNIPTNTSGRKSKYSKRK